MPVQIPRIEATQPSAPNSVGRMEVSVPNMAQATAPLAEGIQKGTSKVVDAFEARQNEIAKQRASQLDFKSTEEDNSFALWSKQKRAEINQKEGDTTKDWIEYDKQAEERYKQVYSKYESMDSDFKQLLDNKLNTTYRKEQTFRNIEQSEQNYKWKSSVADNKVKLEQDSFFNSGTRLDIKDPETFNNLKTFARDMINTRLAHAEQTGQLTYKEDGTPDFETGPVSVVIRKDIGDAVIPLVKTLNAAGKVAEGKKVIEEYSKYLNAADRAKLMSDNDESDVRNQAINKLSELKLQLGRQDIAISDIDLVGGISEPIRFKMKELNQIEEAKKKQERDRNRENFLDAEYNRLVTKQASTNNYVNEADYVNSEEGKNAATNTSPEQFERLRKIVAAPIKSSPSALAMLNKGDRDGTLYKMSAEDKIKMYSGLSEDDRRIAREVMRQQSIDAGRSGNKTSELSGATASRAKTIILDNINEQIQSNPMFQYNTKNKKYKNEEYVQNMLKQYGAIINNDILMAGPAAFKAEIQDKITNKRLQQMINQFKKDKEDDTSWFGKTKFTGVSQEAARSRYPYDGSVPKPKAVLPSSSGANKLQPTKPKVAEPVAEPTQDGLPPKTDRKAWNALYRKANGKAPTNVNEFDKFIDDNLKK